MIRTSSVTPFWPTSRPTEEIYIPFTATSGLSPYARSVRRGNESWSNPKVLTVFILLFLCGMACGSVLTSTMLHWRIQTAAASSQMGLDQLKDKLHLTPEQQAVVARELDEYVKYYQNIEEEREDVAQHGKRRIMSVLNPDQRKVFLAMFPSSTLPTKADSDE